MDRGEAAAFWDERYRKIEKLWPLKANALLVEFASGLAPGRALDIGAGEGRNSIWLATRGWQVTALDVSEVALGRAAERAAAEGAELDCVAGDWRDPFPVSAIDLAVISFMHPRPDERATMFRRTWEALVPGGHLFTIGVHASEHERRGPPDADRLYTPELLQEALAAFELLRCQALTYEGEGREGPRTVTDVVAIARRPLTAARGTPGP